MPFEMGENKIRQGWYIGDKDVVYMIGFPRPFQQYFSQIVEDSFKGNMVLGRLNRSVRKQVTELAQVIYTGKLKSTIRPM